MKRLSLTIIASGLLLCSACGDVTTEKFSHSSTEPITVESQPPAAGTVDTASSNAGQPAPSAAPSSTGN